MPLTRLARHGRVSRAPRSSTVSRSRFARGSRTLSTCSVRPSASVSDTWSRSMLRGLRAAVGVSRRRRGMGKA